MIPRFYGIQKGVPIPGAEVRVKLWPVLSVAVVGDSILIPTEDIVTAREVIAEYVSETKTAFIDRGVTHGVRVWRVK